MLEISSKEIFRRLHLIRNTRLDYIKKYGLQNEEIQYTYDTLDKLDQSEYIDINSDTLTRIEYGIYVDKQEIHYFDSVKSAELNRGEVQCYWGESETIYGKFKKRLGYVYVNKEILLEECSDEKILEIEKEYFKEKFHFIKYKLNQDLNYKKKNLHEMQLAVTNIKTRLKQLNEITIE